MPLLCFTNAAMKAAKIEYVCDDTDKRIMTVVGTEGLSDGPVAGGETAIPSKDYPPWAGGPDPSAHVQYHRAIDAAAQAQLGITADSMNRDHSHNGYGCDEDAGSNLLLAFGAALGSSQLGLKMVKASR